jgi:hypothetical protein
MEFTCRRDEDDRHFVYQPDLRESRDTVHWGSPTPAVGD